MQKTKIILNPIAGMNSARTKIPLIKQLMEKYNLQYELVLTERIGHAVEIAESTNPTEFPVVVAAGGDGTCNEVFNGLMRAKTAGRVIPIMGALPIGRGNDFSYAMGLPKNLEENIKILSEGYTKYMDVGKVTGGLYPDGRYFGNGIGVGFSTIVGFEAAKMKFLHGFITYVIGALKTLFLFYKAPNIRMELDEKVHTQKSIETSIMIGRRFGGAFFMAPEAINDDGLFDLCIANNAPRREMLMLIGKYMKGTQKENKYIKTKRAQKVVLSTDDGFLAVHADGETICEKGKSLVIECIPRQIEIVTRPDITN
jgi:YegS/Rv2252/BmrU family lipid kinase